MDWDSITCDEQYKMFMEMISEPKLKRYPSRLSTPPTSLMAKHFVWIYDEAKYFNPNKRKALVIMNSYHGYTRIPPYLPNPTEPFSYSTSSYIYKTYPMANVKGILINFYPTSNQIKLVAEGKWDAAFKLTGNKNIGFWLRRHSIRRNKVRHVQFWRKRLQISRVRNPFWRVCFTVSPLRIFNWPLASPIYLMIRRL